MSESKNHERIFDPERVYPTKELDDATLADFRLGILAHENELSRGEMLLRLINDHEEKREPLARSEPAGEKPSSRGLRDKVADALYLPIGLTAMAVVKVLDSADILKEDGQNG